MFGHKINFKISVLALSSSEIATLNLPRKATINAKIMDYILCDFSHRKNDPFYTLCYTLSPWPQPGLYWVWNIKNSFF